MSSLALEGRVPGHRPVGRLLAALHVEKGERRPFLLLFGLAACLGVARVCFYTSSNALFLARFDTRYLPYVYMATAAVTAATGILYSRLKARVPLGRLFGLSAAVLAGSLVALRVALALSDSPLVVLLLPVWFMVLWIFGLLILWGAANLVFDVQQGKRLYGLIGVGEVLSDSLTGLSVSALVAFGGTENLIVLAALALLVARHLLGRLSPYVVRRAGGGVPGAHAEERGRLRLLRNPYVLLIAALSATMNVVYYFVDLGFMREVQRHFTSSEAAASFLGRFYAVLGLTNLLGRAVLTSRLLNRFGLHAGLLSLPLVVGALMATAALTAPDGSTGIVFWLAISSMFAWGVLRDGMDKPGTLLLYQPLPASERLLAQITVETVFDPLATGVAGAILLVLAQRPDLGTPDLARLALPLVCVWVVVALATRRQYARVLADALAKRRLNAAELPLHGAENLAILRRGLQSPHAGEAIYCLSVLADMGEPVDDAAVRLLSHPDEVARGEALRLIAARDQVNALHAVRVLVGDPSPAVRAAAVRTLAALGESDVVDELRVLLEGADRGLQKAALVGLLRDGGVDGILAAAPRLKELEGASEPSGRILAAQVLGEVALASFYRPLIALMYDSDRSVRREALKAAARIANPRLWPLVVDGLASPDTRRQAATALVAGGEAATPYLEPAFLDDGASRAVRMELVAVAGHVGGARALAFLLRQIRFPDGGVRHGILTALRRAGFTPNGEQQVRLRELLAEEVAMAATTLAAIVDLRGARETEAVVEALARDHEQGRARIFLLLSFLYPARTVMDAYAQITAAAADRRAYALEALEYVLRPEHRSVLPVAAGGDPAQVLERLGGAVRLGREARLVDLLARSAETVSPWTKVRVLQAMGRLRGASFRGALREWAEHPDAVTAETARWAQAEVDGSAPGKPLARPGGEWRREGGMLAIEKVLTLKGTEFFGGAPDEALAEVAAVAEEVEVKAGERIITRGDLGTCMYIVVDGEVRVHVEDRTVVVLGARSVVGELSALDPEPRLASVTATRDSLLLKLDYDTLDELMARDPSVSRAIIRHLCRRFREDRQQRFAPPQDPAVEPARAAG